MFKFCWHKWGDLEKGWTDNGDCIRRRVFVNFKKTKYEDQFLYPYKKQCSKCKKVRFELEDLGDYQ